MAALSRSAGRSRRVSVLMISVVTALAVLPVLSASAADVTVDCTSDSINTAITAASPGDSIFVKGSCIENVVVDKDITLHGGFFEGTIDGGGLGSVVAVLPDVTLAMNGLTLRNGAAPDGAGIFNEGAIDMHDMMIISNGVDGAAGYPSERGGGIYNAPGARLAGREVFLTDNEVTFGGGAMWNEGDAAFEDSWVRRNTSSFSADNNDDLYNSPSAGGVVNFGGMDVFNTEFSGNNGLGSGGLFNGEGGALTVASSQFFDNGHEFGEGVFFGAGLRNEGEANVHLSTFENNHAAFRGGGAFNSGHLVLSDSEFISNTVHDEGGIGGGGGLFNSGVAEVTNTHFDDNVVYEDTGGGILNRGDLRITGGSISRNTALGHGWAVAGIDSGQWFGFPTLLMTGVEVLGNRGALAGGIHNSNEFVGNDLHVAGNSGYSAGGLLSAGNASVSGSTFEGNDQGGLRISAGERGHVGSSLVMTDSFVHENTTTTRGGGISLERGVDATLTNVEVSGNSANTGGGVYVDFGATLNGSSVAVLWNVADPGGGGGLFVIGGIVSLEDTVVNANRSSQTGGGISITSRARVDLHRTHVIANEAQHEGGGIHNYQSTLSLEESQIEGNMARDGGGVSSSNGVGPRSSLTLHNTDVFENQATRWGGGIYNVAGSLDVIQSALTSNWAADSGGGLFNKQGIQQAVAFLFDTTVGDNWAPEGAGIFNHAAELRLEHVTLTENLGGSGLGALGPRAPLVINSIVAGNPLGDCEQFVFGSGGHNVVGDCLLGPAPGDATGIGDPQLDPVGHEYLGFYLPRAGSPAVDHVPVGFCTSGSDQVGTSRPQGAACDAGSVEAEGDTQPPSVDVGFPRRYMFTESPVTLFGTASDDSGVARVRVAIRDRSTGLWLQDDLVSFGRFNRFDAALSDPGGMSTDWSFTVGLPDGLFNLSVRATDVVGKEVSVSPWHPFNVDATTGDAQPPSVDADYAQNTVFRTDRVVLTGTASDNVGVAQVRVAIRHRATGHWLQADMVTFAPRFHRFQAELSDPDAPATAWTFEVSLPTGGYTTSVRATDMAGNEESISPWRRFSVID